MYKVLVIVPRAGGQLDVSAELNQITRYNQTVVLSEDMLQKPVTAAEVLRRTQNEAYDIVHIASHGTPEGVLMAENSLLTADQTLRMGKAVRAKLIYINTCSGGKLAQYLVDHGVPVVIASNYDQKDITAWSVAAYFYEFLSQANGDFMGAFRLAKPSDGGMTMWLSDQAAAQISPLVKTVDELLVRSNERQVAIEGINTNIARLNGRIHKLLWFQASLWLALICLFIMLAMHLWGTT